MVRQSEINEVYEKKHQRIKEITKSYIAKTKRSYLDADGLISESYFYLISVSNKIKTEEIESVILKYIKNIVNWNTNPTHRNEICKEHQDIEKIEIADDEREDLRFKSVDNVYNNSNDFIKKRIHEVVVVKKIFTVRKLASHFDISQPSAHELLKQLKTDINEHFKIASQV